MANISRRINRMTLLHHWFGLIEFHFIIMVILRRVHNIVGDFYLNQIVAGPHLYNLSLVLHLFCGRSPPTVKNHHDWISDGSKPTDCQEPLWRIIEQEANSDSRSSTVLRSTYNCTAELTLSKFKHGDISIITISTSHTFFLWMWIQDLNACLSITIWYKRWAVSDVRNHFSMDSTNWYDYDH